MTQTNHLLAISLMLSCIRRIAVLERGIRNHDRELAAQLKQAANSTVLNLSEGQGSTRGARRARFENAHASAKETRNALACAAAWGYIELDAKLDDDLDHVAAMSWRLMHPRQ